jgi:hypothetical protein
MLPATIDPAGKNCKHKICHPERSVAELKDLRLFFGGNIAMQSCRIIS